MKSYSLDKVANQFEWSEMTQTLNKCINNSFEVDLANQSHQVRDQKVNHALSNQDRPYSPRMPEKKRAPSRLNLENVLTHEIKRLKREIEVEATLKEESKE